MEYNLDPYEDKWSDTSLDKITHKRPLGITFLAVFQIIGTLATVGILVALPILFEGNTAEILGELLFYALIIYSIIMIPISLFLSYGLLKGRGWARSYTRIFQILNIITSLLRFNILGVIIPVCILYYLNKPHVLRFFDKKSAFDSRGWYLIIIGFITLFIFSSSIAIYTNPIIQGDFLERNIISSREELLIGTWHNTDRTIMLTFNADYTCLAVKDDIYYNGTWHIRKTFYWVELNWETPFQIKNPYNPDHSVEVKEIYFIGDTISLYARFESKPYYICYKE